MCMYVSECVCLEGGTFMNAGLDLMQDVQLLVGQASIEIFSGYKLRSN